MWHNRTTVRLLLLLAALLVVMSLPVRLSLTFQPSEYYLYEAGVDDIPRIDKKQPSVTADDFRIEYFFNITTPKAVTTLLHFDPHFMGGFRNQHMRFIGFINFAVQHDIHQILLPSIRWGDVFSKGKSASHEMLFDVIYWNERADEFGLPRFVRYDPQILEVVVQGKATNYNATSLTVVPCFNVTSNLSSGLDEERLRGPNTNLRRINTWNEIGKGPSFSHCRRTPGDNGENNPQKIIDAVTREGKVGRYTHLMHHGGATSYGRLWIDYNKMQTKRSTASQTITVDNRTVPVPVHPEHGDVEKAIYKLMRPSFTLRRAIQDTVRDAITRGTKSKNLTNKPVFLALHPRIEHDMLKHKCSRYMDSNLTTVFERLRSVPAFDLLFIALNKDYVDVEAPERLGDLKEVFIENRMLLNRTRKLGLFGTIPMFESGVATAAKIKVPIIQLNSTKSNNSLEMSVSTASLGVTGLVASVVNFFTAVEADIFVGVRGSSYSTDVISVRYYQHQEGGTGGENNYVVGPEGINQVFGPAAPHSCH